MRVYEPYMRVYVQTYAPEARGHQAALSVIVRLICWKQALLLNLKLGWQPVSPSDSPVFTLMVPGHVWLFFTWNLNSGLHAYTAGIFTLWAISPGPLVGFKNKTVGIKLAIFIS